MAGVLICPNCMTSSVMNSTSELGVNLHKVTL